MFLPRVSEIINIVTTSNKFIQVFIPINRGELCYVKIIHNFIYFLIRLHIYSIRQSMIFQKII